MTAADRAETTTATDEEVAALLLAARNAPHLRSTHEQRLALIGRLAAALAARAETTTARVPCPVTGCDGDARYAPPGRGHRDDCTYLSAETTTATDEDAAPIVVQAAMVITANTDEPMWSAVVIAKEMASRGLLATARTRPTREQIAAVVHHVGWEVPEGYEDSLDPENCATCRDALNTADAVLALLDGEVDR